MVLVVGATGRVGGKVVQLLRQAGRPVRALCRSEAKAAPLKRLGAEIAIGDLEDRHSLAEACQGVNAVVTAVTSLNPRRLRAAYRPEVIDDQGHRTLFDVVRRSGAKHLLYVSALGVDHPEAPRQFRIKRVVEESLQASGLPHTILRPSGFMENFLPVIATMKRWGIAPLAGGGRSPITYIATQDVAAVAVEALDQPEGGGRILEFGGAEDLTNRDCVEIAARLLGRRVRIVPIPLAILRWGGEVLRPLLPGLREFLAIVAFVDRFGLRCDHRPPIEGKPWTPISFAEFARRHFKKAPSAIHG